jgi:hypothetical protein
MENVVPTLFQTLFMLLLLMTALTAVLGSLRSDGFDLIAINADRYRSLDHLYRDNQALVRVLGHKNPFQPVHTSTPDSHAASGSEEGVGCTRNVVSQEIPYVLYFAVGYGEADTADAHKSDYAGRLYDMKVLLCVGFQVNEGVAVKEHTLECFLPITPAMRLRDQWQERRHTCSLELRRD